MAWSGPETRRSLFDKESSPICQPDLYSSSSFTRTLPNPEMSSNMKGARYLLFEPQFGFSNQLQAVVQAYFWAKALGRTLVVPPAVIPRVNSYRQGHEEKILDLRRFLNFSDHRMDHLAKKFRYQAIKPILFSDFIATGLKPRRIIRATKGGMFDKRSNVMAQLMNLQNLDFVDLRHSLDRRISIKYLRETFDGCEDEVLYFDSLFFTRLIRIDAWQTMPYVLPLERELTVSYTHLTLPTIYSV